MLLITNFLNCNVFRIIMLKLLQSSFLTYFMTDTIDQLNHCALEFNATLIITNNIIYDQAD